MSDNPLNEEFGGTVSNREELEDLWEKVDAFAGTLTEEFNGDVRVTFSVSPVLEVEQEEE